MILITGASGNVGREVLKNVAQTGANVRAAYQSPQSAVAPAGAEVVAVDYNQPETLHKALDGVEKVFLVGPPTQQLVDLERKAVDVIVQSKVKHVVKLSAMGGRDAIFPRQHTESEDYIRSTGMPYTFLRPNGFMQNLVNYSSPTIKSIGKFFGSEGEGEVSQIDIHDIASVAARTLTEDGHTNKVYTLTGPEALNNYEVAKMLSEVLGRDIEFVNLPPDQLRTGLIAAGVPEWNADALIDLQRLYHDGKASEVTADVHRILGRGPASLRQFLTEHRQAFEETTVTAG
jgi:uncharacterized protein YbjT (DUF2867 family)